MVNPDFRLNKLNIIFEETNLYKILFPRKAFFCIFKRYRKLIWRDSWKKYDKTYVMETVSEFTEGKYDREETYIF